MRRIISALIALIAAIGIYPLSAHVVEVDATADLVIIETASGIRYAFGGTEDWQVGDGASCIMWDGGTPSNVYDDAILIVRYSGINR